MKVGTEKGYSVICISLYDEDLAELDATVAKLREQGFKRASRSAAIRAALRSVTAEHIAGAARGEMGRVPLRKAGS